MGCSKARGTTLDPAPSRDHDVRRQLIGFRRHDYWVCNPRPPCIQDAAGVVLRHPDGGVTTIALFDDPVHRVLLAGGSLAAATLILTGVIL